MNKFSYEAEDEIFFVEPVENEEEKETEESLIILTKCDE